MSKLVALREALDAVDPGGDGARANGWTGPRRRAFLEHIADGLFVEQACRAVGLSPASAYALRHRAEAFALGWRAAILIARDHLAEKLLGRAVEGQVDTWTRDGQVVTRHRHDNRLAMNLLTRLDRLAEGWPPPGYGAARRRGAGAGKPPAGEASALADAAPSPADPNAAARLVAMDFPAFLDLVEGDGGAQAIEAFVAAAIARRYPQPSQLGPVDVFGRPVPPGPVRPHVHWWWDDPDAEWRTAAPPPDDFKGYEDGEPGDRTYWRTLTRAEIKVADADLKAQEAARRDALWG